MAPQQLVAAGAAFLKRPVFWRIRRDQHQFILGDRLVAQRLPVQNGPGKAELGLPI